MNWRSDEAGLAAAMNMVAFGHGELNGGGDILGLNAGLRRGVGSQWHFAWHACGDNSGGAKCNVYHAEATCGIFAQMMMVCYAHASS